MVQEVLDAAKAHPGRKLARVQIVWAAGVILFAAILAVFLSPVAGISMVAVASVFVWSSLIMSRSVLEVSLLNHALDACRRGEREDAAALVDAAAARPHSRLAARTVAGHRALLALDAGDAKAAEKHATDGLAVSLGWIGRDLARTQITWLSSLRALARASLRDDAGAKADADRACDVRHAAPVTYACGELARAIVAANEDRKPEVREILERCAPVMDDVGGRERALARGLARFAAERKRTIYRHPAKTAEPDASNWLAPTTNKSSVAAFEPTSAEVPLSSVPRAIKPARARWKYAVLWAALVLMFLAIWQVLNPSVPPSAATPRVEVDAADPFWFSGQVLGPFFCVVFMGLLALNTMRATRQRTVRREATLGALRGERSALAALESQAKGRSAEAALVLARIAERSGDFTGALARCEEGLAYTLSPLAMRAMSYDLLSPALTAERAFCLAALGRLDEATIVIGSMPNARTYAHAGTAHFRVRLALALVRGDRGSALAIARTRGDALALPSRDAFLVDLLEATEGRGADDEEWSRLHAELAADPALAKWIEHFMPQNTLQRRVAEPLLPEEELDDGHAEAAAPSS